MKKLLKLASCVALASTLVGCGEMSNKEKAKWAEDNGYIYIGDKDIATNASEALESAKGGQLDAATIREISLDMLRGFPLYFDVDADKDGNVERLYPGSDTAEYPQTWNGTAVKLVLDGTTVKEEVVIDFRDETKVYTYNATSKQFTAKAAADKAAGDITGYELYELITTFSNREMMQIATSYLNKDGKVETGLSSIEFWIDTETMHLWAYSEPGTEKVEHLLRNDDTSLFYVKQIEEEEYDARGYNYWNSYGVQVNGKGTVHSEVLTEGLYDNEEILEKAVNYMITMRGAKYFAAQALANGNGATVESECEALVRRALVSGYWVEVDPDQYVVTALWNRYITVGAAGEATINNWKDSKFRIQAKWAETLYGKADRQTLYFE